MRLSRNVGFPLFRLVTAAVISYLIFVGVSMLHATFSPASQEKKEAATRAIEAEIIRKEPEPAKKAQQRVRQVNNASAGQKAGGGERMAMKFAPDLGLDAGPAGGEGVALQNQEVGAEVFDEGQTDEDVVSELMTPVPYPDKARDQGAEGEFVALIVIGHTGRVTAVDIVKSPHSSITAEARKMFATWRFKPAKNKGVPVSVRKRVIYDFRLD